MEFSHTDIAEIISKELKKFQSEGLIDENAVINSDTRLIGSGTILKSRTLVELLIGIEEQVQINWSKKFDWTDDKAMSAKNSPFRDVASLTDYVIQNSVDEK